MAVGTTRMTRSTRMISRRQAVGLATGMAGGVISAACALSPGPTLPGNQSKGSVTLGVSVAWGSQVQADQWKPVLDAWQQHYPNITLDVNGFQGNSVADYKKKLITVLAGGEVYDALYTHFSIAGEMMAKKLFIPLDQLLAKDKNEVNLADFPASTLAGDKWKGTQYALPFDNAPISFWYNADLFRRYGVRTPTEYVTANTWTWDQFLQTASQTTRGVGDDKTWGYGGQGRGTGVAGVNFWLPYVWSFGGDLWNEDMTAFALDTKEAMAGLQFFADLIVKHQVAPPVDQGGQWAYGTGKVPTGVFSVSILQLLKTYDWALGMAPNPSGPAGRFHYTGSGSYGIYAGRKHQDEAWLWCRWITTDAVKVWLDLGLWTAPLRKSQAQYQGWLKARQPWETEWPKVLETIRAPRAAITGWQEIMTVFSEQYDQALAGKITVQQAVEAAKKPINDILEREAAA